MQYTELIDTNFKSENYIGEVVSLPEVDQRLVEFEDVDQTVIHSYCNGTYWTSTPYDGSSSLVQYVYANKGEFNKTWSDAREKGVVVSTRFKTSCLDLYQ